MGARGVSAFCGLEGFSRILRPERVSPHLAGWKGVVGESDQKKVIPLGLCKISQNASQKKLRYRRILNPKTFPASGNGFAREENIFCDGAIFLQLAAKNSSIRLWLQTRQKCHKYPRNVIDLKSICPPLSDADLIRFVCCWQ
jgi:hypothetical protein